MLQSFRTEFLREFTRESPINPYALLAQLLYIHAFGGLGYSLPMLLSGLIFMLVFRRNYFWWWGIIIHPNLGWLAPINILMGLLSCNERWKTLLFMYVSADLVLLSMPSVSLFYNTVALIGLQYEVYQNMPFSNIKSNQIFFVSFSLLWIAELCRLLQLQINLTNEQNIVLLGLLMPLGGIASMHLIRARICSAMNGPMEQLKHPWQVVHFVQYAQRSFRNKLQRDGAERRHRSLCANCQCFCRKDTPDFVRLLTHSLYMQGFKKFASTEYDDCLLQFYVIHLIRQGMFPLAVETTLNSKQKKVSLYKRIKKKRVEFMLLDQLEKIEQDYDVKAQRSDPFNYERRYGKLKRQLLDLIETKASYWQEVGKKMPKIVNLNNIGRQYSLRLNEMNDYYQKDIRSLEQEIRIFSGSIIYNLYLLVATNYKELAESNIKALRKFNESVQQASSQSNQNYKYYTVKVSLCRESMHLIENVNRSFGRLLGGSISKDEIIGKDIGFIVPEPYVEQHKRGCIQLRDDRRSGILGHNQQPLLFKTMSGGVVPTIGLVKYSIDILNQLSVICIIKHVKSDCEWFMLDGDATFKYSSGSSQNKVWLEAAEVKTLIRNFRKKWDNIGANNTRYTILQAMKTQVRHGDNTYTVTITSPLSSAFVYPEKPPLVLCFYNETATIFADEQIVDEMDVGCMRKINVLLEQAECDSQASISSRQNKVIAVLRNFEKMSVGRIFRGVMAALMGVFLISTVTFTVQSWWINITDATPTNLQKMQQVAYNIQERTAEVVSNGLSMYSIRTGIFTEQAYSDLSQQANYTSVNYAETLDYCRNLKQLISTDLATVNDGKYTAITDSLMSRLQISTAGSNQSVVARSFFHVSISDCFQLANKQSLEQLSLGQAYWQSLFPFYFEFIDVVERICISIANQQHIRNYAILAASLLLIGAGAIWVCLAKRKVEQQQDYIYELMISIESELIDRELTQLNQLEASLKSRNNSTANFEETKTFNPNAYGLGDQDTQSENRGLMQSRRKRTSELDKNGYSRSRWFFAVSFSVFVLLACGMFVVNWLQIQSYTSNIETSRKELSWRNQRIHLLMNVKKKLFHYHLQESVLGGSLDDWLVSTISFWKAHYLAVDSTEYVPFSCSADSDMCDPRSYLSTEMALNVLLENLVSQANDDLSVDKMPIAEALELAGTQIDSNVYPKRAADRDQATQSYNTLCLILYVGGVCICLALTVCSWFYLRSIQKQYMKTIQTVTLLSEDMIKKNKRVESFLQRLSRDN